jgi:hypothetical protein
MAQQEVRDSFYQPVLTATANVSYMLFAKRQVQLIRALLPRPLLDPLQAPKTGHLCA